MASIKEEFESLKIRIAKGEGHQIIHVVDHAAEQKRKRENPARSTRIVLNARTPDAWRKLQTEKERFFEIAVDPHIAVDFIIRAMEQVSDDTLRAWLTEGSGPPEDLPEWAK